MQTQREVRETGADRITICTETAILAVISRGEWLDYRDAHNLGLLRWEIDPDTGEETMLVRRLG